LQGCLPGYAYEVAARIIRAVVHPGHEDPRRPLPGRAVAPGASRAGHPRRARVHPALARWAVVQAPRPDHLLPVPRRPGPSHATRDRRAGRQGRQSGRRARPGQAEPVHRPRRRDQERQPAAGGEGPGPGRAEGHDLREYGPVLRPARATMSFNRLSDLAKLYRSPPVVQCLRA
jgi:hypothetical protein